MKQFTADAAALSRLVDVKIEDAARFDLHHAFVVEPRHEEIFTANFEDAEQDGGTAAGRRGGVAEEVQALFVRQAVLRSVQGRRVTGEARWSDEGGGGVTERAGLGEAPRVANEEDERKPARRARTHHGGDGVGELLRAGGAHARLVHQGGERALFVAGRERIASRVHAVTPG